MSNDSQSKRRRWWTDMLGLAVWAGVHLVSSTLRIRSEREVSEDEYDRPVVICFWHNRSFVCPISWNASGFQYPMGIMTSASKDGALLEQVVKYSGLKCVRGSSHRRGVAAFLEAMKMMEQEKSSFTVAPDGPKGPIYKLHLGVVKLASLTGTPVVPVCIEYEKCWRIKKAWDKYCIPKPFSNVNILWKKPMVIPPNLSDGELNEYALKIEQSLCHGLPDFEPLNN